jgi:hypothetical protein
VAPFDPAAQDRRDLDFLLMRDGFVSMFFGEAVLGDTLRWLDDAGYQVVDIDLQRCSSTEDVLDAVARALHFPDYFGRHLDALNDCLRDVTDGEYGFDLTTTGLVIVMRHYHLFVERDPHGAHVVLDIMADRFRDGALLGRRMMCLIESRDPALRIPDVGATRVAWNFMESSGADRGLGRTGGG